MQIHTFDGVAAEPMLLCELPGKDPGERRRYLLPANLVEWLREFDGTQETDAVIRRYAATHPQFSIEKLQSLAEKYFVQRGLLLAGDAESGSEAISRAQSYMYVQRPLLPPLVVNALSTPVSWLFRRKIMVGLLPVFAATQYIFFKYVLVQHAFKLNDLSGGGAFLLIVMVGLMGFFHELGHAAALNYFGFKQTSIGWGLYLSFTVFYTDLSDAWRLNRKERAIVDLGGIYFHCVALTFLLGLALCLKTPVLVYCFFVIDLQIAGSLNPFLRMDGYWLVSDILGIVDLRRECLFLAERALWRVRLIKTMPRNSFSQMNKQSRFFLTGYLGAGCAFSFYLYKILVAQIVFVLLPDYPRLLLTLWNSITTEPLRLFTLLNLSGGALFKGFVLFGFFRMIYGATMAVGKWMIKLLHESRRSSPVTPAQVSAR